MPAHAVEIDVSGFQMSAGQLHAPVGVGAGASQPMVLGGELMTPQQMAEYQQQMSSMQQQHQAALMQHQVAFACSDCACDVQSPNVFAMSCLVEAIRV